MVSSLAVVVIGRNEGDRLGACLSALRDCGAPLIYVDSGSTDGSVGLARRYATAVVELDPGLPFTAARARNEGLRKALELQPGLELVQFVDGDCEMSAEWLGQGASLLRQRADIAIVCGCVRERSPDRSVYNRLCGLEWKAPLGEVRACGGNAMARVSVLREFSGFHSGLISGEERELCIRLRQRGWKVFRCEAPMVVHDANMTRFSQWWKRALRSGWGYAEVGRLHPEDPVVAHENRSIFFWGILLPAFVLSLAVPTGGLSLLALLGYPVLLVRVYRGLAGRGMAPGDALLKAAFTVLARLPQAVGRLQFAILHPLGRRRRVVDWRTGA